MLRTSASTMKNNWRPLGYSSSSPPGAASTAPSRSVLLASPSFLAEPGLGESARGVGMVLLSVSFSRSSAAAGEGARVEAELCLQLEGRCEDMLLWRVERPLGGCGFKTPLVSRLIVAVRGCAPRCCDVPPSEADSWAAEPVALYGLGLSHVVRPPQSPRGVSPRRKAATRTQQKTSRSSHHPVSPPYSGFVSGPESPARAIGNRPPNGGPDSSSWRADPITSAACRALLVNTVSVGVRR